MRFTWMTLRGYGVRHVGIYASPDNWRTCVRIYLLDSVAYLTFFAMGQPVKGTLHYAERGSLCASMCI